MRAALTTPLLLDDDTDIETHQRTDIRTQAAIQCRDQNTFPDPGQADCDLLHARIERPRGAVDTLQQGHLVCPRQYIQRIVRRVQRTERRHLGGLHPPLLPGPGNRTGGTRCLAQGGQLNTVAVGKTGFFTGQRAHTNALVEVETAFLDDTVFEHPALGNLTLEIQVAGIHARPGQLTEQNRQLLKAQTTRSQQMFADLG